MTDYKEQQRDEIEALESIYPDELEIVETEPFHSFRISIEPQLEDESEQVSVKLQFTYVPEYPDEIPLMEVVETENVPEDIEAPILEFLQEQAEENKGMVMVFTLVAALQEKILTLLEEKRKAEEEEKMRREQEEEEKERKLFEGTRVTIESFLAWKAKFDQEMREKMNVKQESESNRRMTGKEMFLRDASMNDSDVQFLQSEGDVVEVDESLFQDMDDLDIGDDEDFEDDED